MRLSYGIAPSVAWKGDKNVPYCRKNMMPPAGFEPALQEEAGGQRRGSKRVGDEVGYLNPHLKRLLDGLTDANAERRP
jgi:hypothetical protein